MKIDKEYTKFTHYTMGSGDYPETKIELTIESGSTLSQTIDVVDRFLKAMGYVYDGELSIVDNDYEQE